MYCYHCGKKLDRKKLEEKQSSYASVDASLIDDDTKINYVCPRCGHLVYEGMTEEDAKSLSRATHAQIQRGNNSFARGMCSNAIGLILLVIGLLFFVLAMKPSQGFKLQTNCAEFIVFIVLTSISVILLGFGILNTVLGLRTKIQYNKLLKDLNNKTFVQ